LEITVEQKMNKFEQKNKNKALIEFFLLDFEKPDSPYSLLSSSLPLLLFPTLYL